MVASEWGRQPTARGARRVRRAGETFGRGDVSHDDAIVVLPYKRRHLESDECSEEDPPRACLHSHVGRSLLLSSRVRRT